MKIGPNIIDTIQPVKSFEELLAEVNEGQYENFKAFLVQNKTTDIVLSNQAQIDFFHLGCALKDTVVTLLNLSSNNIDDDGAIKLGKALKGSNVNTLYLAGNNIGALGATELVSALKDTVVHTLNLEHNNINNDDTDKLGEAFKDTIISTLNLCCNNIYDDGAAKLVKALKGSSVKSLDLGLNQIGDDVNKFSKALKGTTINTLSLDLNYIREDGAAALATCIPDTFLMNVEIGSEHHSLNQALALNKRKLIQTPYTATCLMHLPKSEKTKYSNLPALGNNASAEEMLKFAGGILVNLGAVLPEVQAAIISFLPLMNSKGALKLQVLAKKFHGQGLQIEADTNYPTLFHKIR